LAYGSESKHITTKGLTAKTNTNIIERFHSTLKTRTRVMRGLKKRESAQLILDGWLVHYNYFRPHMSLGDKTPAEKAGITSGYHNWADVTLKDVPQAGETIRDTELKPVVLEIPQTKPFKVVRLGKRAF
jgi:hypothetical protein